MLSPKEAGFVVAVLGSWALAANCFCFRFCRLPRLRLMLRFALLFSIVIWLRKPRFAVSYTHLRAHET